MSEPTWSKTYKRRTLIIRALMHGGLVLCAPMAFMVANALIWVVTDRHIIPPEWWHPHRVTGSVMFGVLGGFACWLSAMIKADRDEDG